VLVQDTRAADAEVAGLNRVTGAYVTSVEEGGPADQAGVEAGDVVLELDGEEINDGTELTTRLAQHLPGERVTLTLFRAGATTEATVELGAFPRAEQERRQPRARTGELRLGINVTSLTPAIARELGYPESSGLLIAQVASGSAAARAGLGRGQLILAINGQPIETPQDLRRVAEGIEPGQAVSFRVRDPALGEAVLNFRAGR
ncbi:MAG TPA: PDZ domain-containing protein, partial [Longimicrobiales bacterium]|nr:PDZ domain-containing protein [Longimicrobiales bacterium]